MRKYAVVVLLVSLVSFAAFSVIGQEEPLPSVTPKDAPALVTSEFPPVVLAVEPIRALHEPTLAEAARRNDYVTFDALYRKAKERGESVAAFATLHELWSWSMADPIGAFYGSEMHDRLAAAYPDYAKYIADQRIVDSRGNVFYPTSETRAFLLAQALEARAPRVQVAANEGGAPGAERGETRREPASAPKPATTATRTISNAAKTPATAPTTPTAASALRPPLSAPAAAPAPSVEAPSTVPVATPATTVAPLRAPLSAPAPPSTPAPVPAAAPAPASNVFATRGILLLVIGLIGIGVLAAMLRTPRETPQVTILKTEPETPDAPVAPVEPLRRPGAPAPKESRATGSHG